MDIKDIEKLVKLIESSKLEEFRYKDSNGSSIHIIKSPRVLTHSAPAVLAPLTATQNAENTQGAPAPEAPKNTINSPLVGTFYIAPSPDAKVFVTIGTSVSKGDVLCIIEAMKVMNKIKADKSGIIKKILVQDGDGVQYGQALFEID